MTHLQELNKLCLNSNFYLKEDKQNDISYRHEPKKTNKITNIINNHYPTLGCT